MWDVWFADLSIREEFDGELDCPVSVLFGPIPDQPALHGVLAALLVFAVFTGRKVPLLTSDRAALLGLVVIGMAICAQAGIGRVAASGEWLHPLSILGYLLRAAIILVGIAALFGKQIPPLTSYHQSFIAVVGIAAAKLVLTTIHRLFL